jgi:glycosyltransferase involved in cell wall biosynthesis
MEASALKILFVIPGKKVDSPQSMSFAKRLARALEEQRAQVEVMISVKSGNPLHFIRQGMALRRLARLTRPDVVVAQYGTFTGLLVALFAPRPVIVTYRGSDLNPTPSENRLYVLLKHLASHLASFLADGIVCVSRELAGRLVCRKPVEVIPSSTDTELFRPRDRDHCRETLGWERDLPTAVFLVGNNPGKKRLDLALAVNELVTRRECGVRMKILREEIPLARVPLYLNAADCLVYLSNFEGSPNLIREACACNTPIVTLPVGDVREVLDGIAPGRIVERDLETIAEAVCEVTRLRARSNGRSKALCYSGELIARKTLAFYGTIVSGTRKRSTPS